MTKRKNQIALDLRFCLGESLFDSRCLSKVESLLQSDAEPWASDLHIWREGESKQHKIENFVIDVQNAALERGARYERLIQEHGPGPYARRNGSVELRGADRAMTIVLMLDDYLFAPSAGRWLWGNTLSLQIREPRVRASVAIDFGRSFAMRACADLSPWYAHGYLIEEWDRKNMSHEGGGMMATGMDASRYLPGLYWLNFFGDPYCTLIGKERLLNAPAHKAIELDAGVLLCISSTPESWDAPEHRSRESAVFAHLGEQYFFNPRDTGRRTVAPDFGLEALPRNLRFT